MPYVITEACASSCAAKCVEVCPMDCIHRGETQYLINPEPCIDCGACLPQCPVSAIYPDTEVPEAQRHMIALNAAFFSSGPGSTA